MFSVFHSFYLQNIHNLAMLARSITCVSTQSNTSTIHSMLFVQKNSPLGLGAGVGLTLGLGVGCPGSGLGVTGGGIEGACVW